MTTTHKQLAERLRAAAAIVEGLPDDIPAPAVSAYGSTGNAYIDWFAQSPEVGAAIRAYLPGNNWEEYPSVSGALTHCRASVGTTVVGYSVRCACGHGGVA